MNCIQHFSGVDRLDLDLIVVFKMLAKFAQSGADFAEAAMIEIGSDFEVIPSGIASVV